MGSSTRRHPPGAQQPSRSALARVDRVESRLAWPLFVASLVWFACLTTAWVDEHPDPLVRQLTGWLLIAIWGWFVVDYIIRLVLAGSNAGLFVRTRALDLVTIVVPFLRPFMILVTIWRLPVFRKGSPSRQRIRYGLTISIFAFLYVYVNSYLVWIVEKDSPQAQIISFGDAIWWGFTTISTVGYGDLVPITAVGRVLAVALMVGGMIVVGVTAGTVVSAITDDLRSFAVPARDSEAEKPQSSRGGPVAGPDSPPSEHDDVHQIRGQE